MRFKGARTLFNTNKSYHFTRNYGSVVGQYSGMSNIARACQYEMDSLTNSLLEKEAGSLIDSINSRVDLLVTYHSLKLTDKFSLSLEETAYLLKENKTLDAKDLSEQLKVFNHRNILKYCRDYQQVFKEDGQKLALPNKNLQDDYILAGIRNLHLTFVLMFHEGMGRNFDYVSGGFDPPGSLYFYDRDGYPHIRKGQDLLIQNLKEGTYDPFLNAAIIHNEFAKGHHFDEDFGLLFCRLYMNFALMLTGHAPVIIDSTQKDLYLKLVEQDKLADPKPLAKFLVKNLKDTYEKHILPDLEIAAKKNGLDVPFSLGISQKQ